MSNSTNLRKIEKPLFLLLLLCLFPLGISAQSLVKGTVSDESGEPIIGATVKVGMQATSFNYIIPRKMFANNRV